MGATTSTPGRFGAALQTPTTTDLAAMSARDLTPGTMAWVAELDAFFKLTLSTASLVTDEVVAVANIDGMRWIVVPEFTAADATKLATVSSDGFIVQAFRSPVTDLAAAPGATATILPAQGAGIYLNFWLQRLSIVTRGGSITTAPIWKVGTNVAHDNVGTGATVSTTNINNASAIIPATASAGFTLVASGTVEMSTDLVAEITQSAAGSTLTGRIVILGHLTTGL